MLTAQQLTRAAAAGGFRPESLEKAARLLDVLNGLRRHPYLRTRLVLKGGTALNLFVLDMPRLSVDLDVNVVGAASRDVMLAERPKVEQAVTAVCGRLGLQVRRTSGEHAGGKWRLAYTSAFGRPATLELDLNFLLRAPLWPVSVCHSRPIGFLQARDIPLVDVHELAAGKLAALFARSAPRDAFDVVELLGSGLLEPRLLRVGFVVYGGASRRDWRQITSEDVTLDPTDVDRQLVPMLRADLAPARDQLGTWTASLRAACRGLLGVVLPFAESEIEFLSRLNDRGEIVPALLSNDEQLQQVIAGHPALLWKAHNVRQHNARSSASPSDD